jgi:hypothetical protein
MSGVEPPIWRFEPRSDPRQLCCSNLFENLVSFPFAAFFVKELEELEIVCRTYHENLARRVKFYKSTPVNVTEYLIK